MADNKNAAVEEENIEIFDENVEEEVTSSEDKQTSQEAKEADTETTTEAAPENEETDGKSKESEKKGFFKKEKKKDKKDELIEELTDKYKRTFAEFDNFRKRSEKEKSTMYEIGAKDVIEKILPVVDNFERGFNSLSKEDMEQPFVQGMDKIYKQLVKTLEEIGVKPIEAVGNEFDPNLHNAVMHVEDENLGDNVVAEEMQKGYMYRESVVRHSMVKVAN